MSGAPQPAPERPHRLRSATAPERPPRSRAPVLRSTGDAAEQEPEMFYDKKPFQLHWTFTRGEWCVMWVEPSRFEVDSKSIRSLSREESRRGEAESRRVEVESRRDEASGVEWRGVEWSGVDWSGLAWRGVEWSGVELRGVAWRAE